MFVDKQKECAAISKCMHACMHGGVHEMELLYMDANAAVFLHFMLTMETRPFSVQAEPMIFWRRL